MHTDRRHEQNYFVRSTLTVNDDLAKYAGIARYGAAVPATVSELSLTFPDCKSRPVCHTHYDVRVQATETALLTRQPGRVFTDRAGTHHG